MAPEIVKREVAHRMVEDRGPEPRIQPRAPHGSGALRFFDELSEPRPVVAKLPRWVGLVPLLLIVQLWLDVSSRGRYVWVGTGVLALFGAVVLLRPTRCWRFVALAASIVGVSSWMIAVVPFSTVRYSMWVLVAAANVPFVLERRRSYGFTAGSVVSLVAAGLWGLQPMASVLPLAGLVGVSGAVMTFFNSARSEALRANVHMRDLFESIGEAIVVVDSDQRIRFANPGAYRLFGFAPGHLVGESLGVLVPDRFSGSHPQMFADFVSSDRAVLSGDRMAMHGRRSNGEEFPVSAAVTTLATEGGRFAVAIIRDMTEVTSLLDTLADREARLQASLESRERLIASVAHELRTPLTSVVGYTALLLEDPAMTPEDRLEYLLSIAREGGDLTNIVEDLLTGARLEVDRLTVRSTSVQIGPIVQEVVDRHLFVNGGSIAVTGSARAMGDPTRIRQIVRNLLTNAQQHGGDLVDVTIRERSGIVTVSIADNGARIQDEDQERMFGQFESAHDLPGLAPSLGLGLFIGRTLAGLMGGELNYAYESGRTSFTLTLQAA